LFIEIIKAPMEWSTTHDVLLCHEMLAVNPFSAKHKTTQCAKTWETLATNLEQLKSPRLLNSTMHAWLVWIA